MQAEISTWQTYSAPDFDYIGRSSGSRLPRPHTAWTQKRCRPAFAAICGRRLRSAISRTLGPSVSCAFPSQAFRVFDRDGSGALSVDELKLVLKRPGGGHPLSDEEVAKIIETWDLNGDGMLQFEEFERMWAPVESGPPDSGEVYNPKLAMFTSTGKKDAAQPPKAPPTMLKKQKSMGASLLAKLGGSSSGGLGGGSFGESFSKKARRLAGKAAGSFRKGGAAKAGGGKGAAGSKGGGSVLGDAKAEDEAAGVLTKTSIKIGKAKHVSLVHGNGGAPAAAGKAPTRGGSNTRVAGTDLDNDAMLAARKYSPLLSSSQLASIKGEQLKKVGESLA